MSLGSFLILNCAWYLIFTIFCIFLTKYNIVSIESSLKNKIIYILLVDDFARSNTGSDGGSRPWSQTAIYSESSCNALAPCQNTSTHQGGVNNIYPSWRANKSCYSRQDIWNFNFHNLLIWNDQNYATLYYLIPKFSRFLPYNKHFFKP